MTLPSRVPYRIISASRGNLGKNLGCDPFYIRENLHV